MQIGVIFPQTEIGADPADIRTYALSARDMGYQHIVAFDHVLGADPAGHPGWKGAYTHDSLFHEPFALFSYLAAIVPGVELSTGVLVLPQRQAALVAKQAAAVDLLCGGRLRLGVGVGWNAVEYEALGLDFHDRGRRMEEQIDLMRRLWQDPVISFEGRYHRVTAAGINPLPVQRPIPIWIGAYAEAGVKRAAQLADGLFAQRAFTGDWPSTLDQLRRWRQEAGKDPNDFGIEVRIEPAHGSPDDWRRRLDEWRSLGATHISINTLRGGLQGLDAHLAALERAARALL